MNAPMQQGLQHQRQQHQAAVQHEAEHGHQEDPDRVGADLEHAQVHDRVLGPQLANDERHEPGHREHGQRHDEARLEPVVLLPNVEQELQRADADRQQPDAPVGSWT